MHLRMLILVAAVGICEQLTGQMLPPGPPPTPPQAQVPQVQIQQVPNTGDLTNQVNYGQQMAAENERIAQEIRTADSAQVIAVAAQSPIPLVPAEAELRAISASSDQSERLRQLREQARDELMEIRNIGWQLSFAGLTAVLSIQPTTEGKDFGDSGPEDMFRRARELCGEYLQTQAEIESITHEKQKAEERKEAYLNNLMVLTQGNYAVNRSDTTATTPPNQSSKPCHVEERTEHTKVHTAIGSDGYGNKIYSDEDEPYLQPYLVCD